jgi:TPR repeat protein
MDRLAEVWADPGKAGSGLVMGERGVLTARHVIEGAVDGKLPKARVVQAGFETHAWSDARVVWEDRAWDLALLVVDEAQQWSAPETLAAPIVALGSAAERNCEVVGFPDAQVQLESAGESDPLRQSEQAVGTVLPSGQGKAPVASDREVPKRWVPFDVDTEHPSYSKGWQGISGGCVILPDGRLIGVIVAAAINESAGRLYAVPLAEVLSDSKSFRACLAEVLSAEPLVEVRDAPQYRDVLAKASLGANGAPLRVEEADLSAFGVKRADVPGESSPYLDYVARDADDELRSALQGAQSEHRMLLVVGGSAGGKSRSAAEAARAQLGKHQLLVPQHGSLHDLRDLPLEDWNGSVVWLDDVEYYRGPAADDTIEWILDRRAVVVGTIRRSQLRQLMPHDGARDPLGDLLKDENQVDQFSWGVQWKVDELERVRAQVTDSSLLAWVAEGNSPSAWLVAGPDLVDRLTDARDDDGAPVNYALVHTALDWYATGIGQPMPEELALKLTTVPGESPSEEELHDALTWACASVTDPGRSSQSLLRRVLPDNDLAVHDYIQDFDAKEGRPPVGDPIWRAALEHSDSDAGRFNIGSSALVSAKESIVVDAWLPLAQSGDATMMSNLGTVLLSSDPAQSKYWLEKAVELGDANAMNSLGILLMATDPTESKHWWEKAADLGAPNAMNALGVLLSESEPTEAKRWYEKAADLGEAQAMSNLGFLLLKSDPAKAEPWFEKAAALGIAAAMYQLGLPLMESDPAEAKRWFVKAADLGDAQAMNALGVLLNFSEPTEAKRWYEKAADLGDVTDDDEEDVATAAQAMSNLGLLLMDSDPAEAKPWLEKAAELGDADAMNSLGILLMDSDPAEGKPWLEKAADLGNANAMNSLGILLMDSDPAEAKPWLEKAADLGNANAMRLLGVMLDDDPEAAGHWYEKAAELGDADAMKLLGLLLEERQPTEAKRWWEKAADMGDAHAMVLLGMRLKDSDPTEANRWWEKVEEQGDASAMHMVGQVLEDDDPATARRWYEKAADLGDAYAMVLLGMLLKDSDPAEANRWWEKVEEQGDADIIYMLGEALEDDDPGAAKHWYEKAVELGNADAMNKLGRSKRSVTR